VGKMLDDFITEHPLVQMRILWFLEKLCHLEEFGIENKESKLEMIFGRLMELKCHEFVFPLKY